MTTRRLLLVDDHPIIEEGMKVFLESHPEITLVGTAKDARHGLELLLATDPDIVLLDLAMPGMDGIEAIHLYLRQKPNVQIIVFTGIKNAAYLHQALEAGARGYVLKGGPMTQLIDAIHEISHGGHWLSPEMSSGIMKCLSIGQAEDAGHFNAFKSLTTREKQVFKLLAAGKSTADIADILCISPKTVAKHRVAVKSKLNLKNAAEMANYAASIGLVDPHPTLTS